MRKNYCVFFIKLIPIWLSWFLEAGICAPAPSAAAMQRYRKHDGADGGDNTTAPTPSADAMQRWGRKHVDEGDGAG